MFLTVPPAVRDQNWDSQNCHIAEQWCQGIGGEWGFFKPTPQQRSNAFIFISPPHSPLGTFHLMCASTLRTSVRDTFNFRCFRLRSTVECTSGSGTSGVRMHYGISGHQCALENMKGTPIRIWANKGMLFHLRSMLIHRWICLPLRPAPIYVFSAWWWGHTDGSFLHHLSKPLLQITCVFVPFLVLLSSLSLSVLTASSAFSLPVRGYFMAL